MRSAFLLRWARLSAALLLFAQSAPAGDEWRRGSEDRGSRRGADDVADAAPMAPLPRGRVGGERIAVRAGGERDARPVSDAKFQGVMNNFVSEAFKGRDVDAKWSEDGKSVTYTDKATGTVLAEGAIDGERGSRAGTLTLNAQNVAPAAITAVTESGTKSPVGNLSLSGGSVEFRFTESSARRGLAETMEIGRPQAGDNQSELEGMSPGGPGTLGAAMAMNPGAGSFTASVTSFRGQPVIQYTSPGGEAAPVMPGRGFAVEAPGGDAIAALPAGVSVETADGEVISSPRTVQPSQTRAADSPSRVSGAVLPVAVSVGGGEATTVRARVETRGAGEDSARFLSAAVPAGTSLAGAGQATVQLKDGTSKTVPVATKGNQISINLTATGLDAGSIKSINVRTPAARPEGAPAPREQRAPTDQAPRVTPGRVQVADAAPVTRAVAPVVAPREPRAAAVAAVEPALAPVVADAPVAVRRETTARGQAFVPASMMSIPDPAPADMGGQQRQPRLQTPQNQAATVRLITSLPTEQQTKVRAFVDGPLTNFVKAAAANDDNLFAQGAALVTAAGALGVPELKDKVQNFVDALVDHAQLPDDKSVPRVSASQESLNATLQTVGLRVDVFMASRHPEVRIDVSQIVGQRTVQVEGQATQVFTLEPADGRTQADVRFAGRHLEGSDHGLVEAAGIRGETSRAMNLQSGGAFTFTMGTNNGSKPLPGVSPELAEAGRTADTAARADIRGIDQPKITETLTQSVALHEGFHAYFEARGGNERVPPAQLATVHEQGGYLFQLAKSDPAIAKVVLADMFTKAAISGDSKTLPAQVTGNVAALQSLQRVVTASGSPIKFIDAQGKINPAGMAALFQLKPAQLQAFAAKALNDDIMKFVR